MFKRLTLTFCATALFTGCVITTGDTTDTFTDTTNVTLTGETGDTGATVDEPTQGTTLVSGTEGATDSATSDGLTTTGTTAETPTTDATDSGTTVNTSVGSDTETDTGGVLYGNCGWFAEEKYYSCDGVPGEVDPDGISPIACPDGLVNEAACDDESGPVKSEGCCTPEGVLFFCDTLTDPDAPKIYEQDCG